MRWPGMSCSADMPTCALPRRALGRVIEDFKRAPGRALPAAIVLVLQISQEVPETICKALLLGTLHVITGEISRLAGEIELFIEVYAAAQCGAGEIPSRAKHLRALLRGYSSGARKIAFE